MTPEINAASVLQFLTESGSKDPRQTLNELVAMCSPCQPEAAKDAEVQIEVDVPVEDEEPARKRGRRG